MLSNEVKMGLLRAWSLGISGLGFGSAQCRLWAGGELFLGTKLIALLRETQDQERMREEETTESVLSG